MRGRQDPQTGRLEMKTELIIPSYDRVAILMQTIGQVRQLYPELDICLGIQGESPSREQLDRLLKDPHMRVEVLTVPSLTRTLNHCIRTSQADVVLMLDDDAVPFFRWAESHLEAFLKNPGLGFTAGREVRLRKEGQHFQRASASLSRPCSDPFSGRTKA